MPVYGELTGACARLPPSSFAFHLSHGPRLRILGLLEALNRREGEHLRIHRDDMQLERPWPIVAFEDLHVAEAGARPHCVASTARRTSLGRMSPISAGCSLVRDAQEDSGMALIATAAVWESAPTSEMPAAKSTADRLDRTTA